MNKKRVEFDKINKALDIATTVATYTGIIFFIVMGIIIFI